MLNLRSKMTLATPNGTMARTPHTSKLPAFDQSASGSLDVLSNDILYIIIDFLLWNHSHGFEDEPIWSSGMYHDGHCAAFIDMGNRDKMLLYDRKVSNQPRSDLVGLASLARTSRRFVGLVQPSLFKAPVLSIGSYGHFWEKSPIYLFARTLLENPAIAKWPKSLRIILPQNWGGNMATTTSEPKQVARRAVEFVNSLTWIAATRNLDGYGSSSAFAPNRFVPSYYPFYPISIAYP
jgi:hypothetical protein